MTRSSDSVGVASHERYGFNIRILTRDSDNIDDIFVVLRSIHD